MCDHFNPTNKTKAPHKRRLLSFDVVAESMVDSILKNEREQTVSPVRWIAFNTDKSMTRRPNSRRAEHTCF